MPYEIRGNCVYRRDTGKKVGCTKGFVKKYLAALQINAESNDPEIIELKEIIEKLYGNRIMEKSKDVTYQEAESHFNSGGTVKIISYTKGKSTEVNQEKIGNMFNVSPEKVKFKNIIKYGYDDKHYPDKGYRIIEGRDTMNLAKIIKEFKTIGNKSTKNVFGDDKTKDSNSDPTKSFEDYPLSYESAMEKLKGIKDKAKLDRCYEECFAQMDVPHERNMLRAFYKSLRDGMND